MEILRYETGETWRTAFGCGDACPSGSLFQGHLVGGLTSECEEKRLCFLEFPPSNTVGFYHPIQLASKRLK